LALSLPLITLTPLLLLLNVLCLLCLKDLSTTPATPLRLLPRRLIAWLMEKARVGLRVQVQGHAKVPARLPAWGEKGEAERGIAGMQVTDVLQVAVLTNHMQDEVAMTDLCEERREEKLGSGTNAKHPHTCTSISH
jgi:hypothetical protein